MKEASIIYEAYSAAGSSMRRVDMSPEDLNDYIHTKTPKMGA